MNTQLQYSDSTSKLNNMENAQENEQNKLIQSKSQSQLLSPSSEKDHLQRISKLQQSLLLSQASISTKDEKIKELSQNLMRLQDINKQQQVESQDKNIKYKEELNQLNKINQQLKNDYELKIKNLQSQHNEQILELKRIIEQLQQKLKEQQSSLDNFKSSSLHIQDLSILSNQKQEIQTFHNPPAEQQSVQQQNKQNQELTDLGSNFWLVSIERQLKEFPIESESKMRKGYWHKSRKSNLPKLTEVPSHHKSPEARMPPLSYSQQYSAQSHNHIKPKVGSQSFMKKRDLPTDFNQIDYGSEWRFQQMLDKKFGEVKMNRYV